MKTYRTRKSGFTLVEILIVVIILGILAAIVIPQFTNASQDARKNSLTSQLQTIRSQVELYRLQHLDHDSAKLVAGGTTAWDDMTVKSNADGTTTGTPNFGPYFNSAPMNPLNNSSSVFILTSGDATFGGASGTTADGWLFNPADGKIWGTSAKFTKVYDEADPTDVNNDL
jgi:general secretion pathway protein G